MVGRNRHLKQSYLNWYLRQNSKLLEHLVWKMLSRAKMMQASLIPMAKLREDAEVSGTRATKLLDSRRKCLRPS